MVIEEMSSPPEVKSVKKPDPPKPIAMKILAEAQKIKQVYTDEIRHKSLPRPTPPFSKKQSVDSGTGDQSSRSRNGNGKYKTLNEDIGNPYVNQN